MAITIHKQPQLLQPVYNEMVFVLSSDNASEKDFKISTNLIVNGQTLASIKSAVNPQGYAVVDVHKHLQNVISRTLEPYNNNVIGADGSYSFYDITLAEEFRPEWIFDGITGTTFATFTSDIDPSPFFNIGDEISIQQDAPYTYASYNGIALIDSIAFVGGKWRITTNKTYVGVVTSDTGTIALSNYRSRLYPIEHTIEDKMAFNGVFDFVDFIGYDSSIYTNSDYNSNPKGLFLTTLPTIPSTDVNLKGTVTYNVKRSSKIFLNTTNPFFKYFTVEVGGIEYIINYDKVDDIVQIPLGADQLNNSTDIYLWEGGSLSPAPQPIINTTTTSYKVYGYNSDPNSAFQGLTKQGYEFIFDDSCSRYEDIQLLFMDKLGSFVPYHFDLVSRNNKTINRVNYQTDYGKYADAANNWTYNTYDRGVSNLDTKITDVFTITSNWVNQLTSDWLMELIGSPEVYWVKENGEVLAINLTVNNIERKKSINDQIINYTLSFELSTKNNQQNG